MISYLRAAGHKALVNGIFSSFLGLIFLILSMKHCVCIVDRFVYIIVTEKK